MTSASPWTRITKETLAVLETTPTLRDPLGRYYITAHLDEAEVRALVDHFSVYGCQHLLLLEPMDPILMLECADLPISFGSPPLVEASSAVTVRATHEIPHGDSIEAHLLGHLLYALCVELPASMPERAHWVAHEDGAIELSLFGRGWSARLSGYQGETQVVNISDEEALNIAERSSTPWSIDRKKQWRRALSLARRAQNYHGVAQQSIEAHIDPSASLHPSVEVQGEVTVGAQTKVWHFSKLLGPLEIGERCSLGQNVVVERGASLGRNVKIQNNVSIYSGVILEDDVFCGPSMVFTNVGTPRSHYPRRGEYMETRIKRGASIGANATIVCGNALGQYSFVGAGAVVTKDVPDYALVYGNPARIRGWACYCGVSLPLTIDPEGFEEGRCPSCERRYKREGLIVRAL